MVNSYKRRVVKSTKKASSTAFKYLAGGVCAFLLAQKFLSIESVKFGTASLGPNGYQLDVEQGEIETALVTDTGQRIISDSERKLSFVTKTSLKNSQNVSQQINYD